MVEVAKCLYYQRTKIMILTLKIISSVFMALFLIFQIKNTYEDIDETGSRGCKPSEIVIDVIILFLIVLTMINIWF